MPPWPRIAAPTHAAGAPLARRALAAALLASVALHLSALLGVRGAPSGAAFGSRSPVLTVRMIAATALAAQPAATDTPSVQQRASAFEPARPESTAPAQPPRFAGVTAPSGTLGPALPAAPAASPAPTAVTEELAAAPPAPTPPPGLPPAPAYRGSAGLDSPPRPLGDIQPEYPPAAGQQVGRVVLRVLIDEHGHVDNVAVARAFPQGYFEAASIEAFAAAQFAPGTFLGVPVKSQMMVEVQFTPFNRGGTVSGRGY